MRKNVSHKKLLLSRNKTRNYYGNTNKYYRNINDDGNDNGKNITCSTCTRKIKLKLYKSHKQYCYLQINITNNITKAMYAFFLSKKKHFCLFMKKLNEEIYNLKMINQKRLDDHLNEYKYYTILQNYYKGHKEWNITDEIVSDFVEKYKIDINIKKLLEQRKGNKYSPIDIDAIPSLSDLLETNACKSLPSSNCSNKQNLATSKQNSPTSNKNIEQNQNLNRFKPTSFNDRNAQKQNENMNLSLERTNTMDVDKFSKNTDYNNNNNDNNDKYDNRLNNGANNKCVLNNDNVNYAKEKPNMFNTSNVKHDAKLNKNKNFKDVYGVENKEKNYNNNNTKLNNNNNNNLNNDDDTKDDKINKLQTTNNKRAYNEMTNNLSNNETLSTEPPPKKRKCNDFDGIDILNDVNHNVDKHLKNIKNNKVKKLDNIDKVDNVNEVDQDDNLDDVNNNNDNMNSNDHVNDENTGNITNNNKNNLQNNDNTNNCDEIKFVDDDSNLDETNKNDNMKINKNIDSIIKNAIKIILGLSKELITIDNIGKTVYKIIFNNIQKISLIDIEQKIQLFFLEYKISNNNYTESEKNKYYNLLIEITKNELYRNENNKQPLETSKEFNDSPIPLEKKKYDDDFEQKFDPIFKGYTFISKTVIQCNICHALSTCTFNDKERKDYQIIRSKLNMWKHNHKRSHREKDFAQCYFCKFSSGRQDVVDLHVQNVHPKKILQHKEFKKNKMTREDTEEKMKENMENKKKKISKKYKKIKKKKFKKRKK